MQQVVVGKNGLAEAPWGQQTALRTGKIEREGVRHLDPRDPIRCAAMVGSGGRRQGQPKMLSLCCSECMFEKAVERHYSKSQVKKNGHARCNECVAGKPPQCDPILEAEKKEQNIEKPPRGIEGRLCWGCGAVAKGHEVHCQTCKPIPSWFCTPRCKAEYSRLHMVWHIRRMEDKSYDLHIGQKLPEEEITRVLDEWKQKLRGGNEAMTAPPEENAAAAAATDGETEESAEAAVPVEAE